MAYQRLDWFFSRSYTPIANLLKQSGDVQFRPVDLSLWKETHVGQSLYEGEILATEENSQATLSTQDGTTLQLEENSQIKITLQKENANSVLVVTLLKGTATTTHEAPKKEKEGSQQKLEFKAEEAPVQKVRLLSGRKSIDVSEVSSFRMEKQVDQISPLIEVIGGKVEVHTPSTGERQRLDSIIAPVRKKPTVAPQVAELPKVLALSHIPAVHIVPQSFAPEPILQWPERNAVHLWTQEDLSTSKATLVFPFRSLATGQDIQKWTAKIGFAGKEKILAEETPQGQRISIPWNTLYPLFPPANKNNFVSTILELQTGLEIKSRYQFSSDKKEVVGKSLSIEVTSVSDIKGKSILAKFSQLASVSAPTWLEEVPASAYPYQLFLRHGEDAVSIFPLMAGSHGFSLQQEVFPAAVSSLCFIRGNEIVASLQGTPPSGDQLRMLRKSLHASIVYEGKPSDFISLQGGKESAEMILSEIQAHSSFFVLMGRTVKRIDRSLLEKFHSALALLRNRSKVGFFESVKIIDVE